MSSKYYWIFVIVVLLITRFYGFNWGSGYAFNPDENNMATSISQMSFSNLNPHFFAYGQFPLYLGFITQKLINIPNTFINSIYTLRIWSAVFSCLAVLILYLIYSNKFFFLLLIFTPGLIQIAHFGTTESLLLLVFVSVLYLSITHRYFFAAVICGIGIATKISALIFIIPAVLSLAKDKQFIKLFLFLVIILAVFCFLSPYNLINFSDFISAFKYETAVANGSLPVFYTRQFIGTFPYLFQFTHIFPYIAGLPMFVFSIFSLYRPKIYKTKLIMIFSCLIYFLYFGQVFTKWTRFMSPLFFVFPLLSTLYLNRQKPIIKYLLTIICLIPGLIFFSQYFKPDIRITASDWMNQNLPVNSKILSESGNVVNLPFGGKFSVDNFDFYNQSLLSVDNYNYILIPSRRVFKNNFAPKYYQKLFSGQLGFTQIIQFSPLPNLFLNDENAEETWTVFDRPTIRIFQRTSEI
ncbi:MAG: hypothetical protein NTY75_01655 [Candidatus Shapirobacteria bacterium]|nr:hypothetical protein [Candidatus Shapirobacteria bacterium]